jgi:hypothetical protein
MKLNDAFLLFANIFIIVSTFFHRAVTDIAGEYIGIVMIYMSWGMMMEMSYERLLDIKKARPDLFAAVTAPFKRS